jgi:hypothetical protein
MGSQKVSPTSALGKSWARQWPTGQCRKHGRRRNERHRPDEPRTPSGDDSRPSRLITITGNSFSERGFSLIMAKKVPAIVLGGGSGRLLGYSLEQYFVR